MPLPTTHAAAPRTRLRNAGIGLPLRAYLAKQDLHARQCGKRKSWKCWSRRGCAQVHPPDLPACCRQRVATNIVNYNRADRPAPCSCSFTSSRLTVCELDVEAVAMPLLLCPPAGMQIHEQQGLAHAAAAASSAKTYTPKDRLSDASDLWASALGKAAAAGL